MILFLRDIHLWISVIKFKLGHLLIKLRLLWLENWIKVILEWTFKVAA